MSHRLFDLNQYKPGALEMDVNYKYGKCGNGGAEVFNN